MTLWHPVILIYRYYKQNVEPSFCVKFKKNVLCFDKKNLAVIKLFQLNFHNELFSKFLMFFISCVGETCFTFYYLPFVVVSFVFLHL